MLLRDALAGWRRWRAGIRDRGLTHGEWTRVLGSMALFAFLLSFGPVVKVGGQRAGEGLYLWLHPYVLPLRAIRGTTRFGLLVLMVVALLAGLGAAWLLSRLSRRAGRMVTAAVLGALTLDYLAPRPPYRVDRDLHAPRRRGLPRRRGRRRRARVAAQQPGCRRRRQASDRRARPARGQRLRRLRPRPPARAVRYLGEIRAAVRFARRPGRRWRGSTRSVTCWSGMPRRAWAAPRGATCADLSGGFLRFRGRHGTDDLYELVSLPERGVVLERAGVLRPASVAATPPGGRSGPSGRRRAWSSG